MVPPKVLIILVIILYESIRVDIKGRKSYRADTFFGSLLALLSIKF